MFATTETYMKRVPQYSYPRAPLARSQGSGRCIDSGFFYWASEQIPSTGTGLPGKIAIWTSMRLHPGQFPCVRVSNVRGQFRDARCETGGAFAVSIGPAPKIVRGKPRNFSKSELAAVRKWIVLNRVLLLTHWTSDTMDSLEFCERIRPLKRSWCARRQPCEPNPVT